MPSHTWTSTTDLEYCKLNNCILWDDSSITLDGTHLTGSILSDIRDSTCRFVRYNEIIPQITIPANTHANFYVRSGYYEEYDKDMWSDWIKVEDGAKIFEYTLSLTNSRIVADYDIQDLTNIYYSTNETFLRLASEMSTVYINTIDENNLELINQFQTLWSALTDAALVGFARADYDPTLASIYAQDATFAHNIIRLKNKLPINNALLVLEYFPRYFIYIMGKGRYFQWRCDFETHKLSSTPTLKTVTGNYTLNYQEQIEDAFPSFIRRL